MSYEPNQQGASKKGMSGWAWAGIGCGTILILGVIAVGLGIGFCKKKVDEFNKDMQANPERKAAEMIIGLHPDYSVVSSNDAIKEMTIKEDKTGKEMTFSYQDIADGKFEMTTPDGQKVSIGTVDLSKVPAWLTLPADAKATGGYHTEKNGKATGTIVFSTASSVEETTDFFQKSLDSWPSGTGSSNMMNFNGVNRHTLEKKASDKEVVILIQSSGADTTATVTYVEK
jgi:hypothetical protein